MSKSNKAVNKETLRLVLAGARGWRSVEHHPYAREFLFGWPPGELGHIVCTRELVPNYAEDLNAMHEFEEFKGWHARYGHDGAEAYFEKLNEVCHRDGNNNHCASAAQRAEAAANVLGLKTTGVAG